MNIAVVVGTFPTVSETFIVNQIIALQKVGHKVHIFSFNKGSYENLHQSIIENRLLEKVTYHKEMPKSKLKRVDWMLKWVFTNLLQINLNDFFKSLNFIKYKKKALSLELFYKNLWFLKRNKFDVIHVHFAPNAIPIASLKSLGFLKTTKLVVSFHGYDLNPLYIGSYKHKYEILFKYIDRFTVNSLYTKQILLKVKPYMKDIDILPVGIDTNHFKKGIVKKLSNEKIILFVGRLIPIKGADLTIEILNELHKRGQNNTRLVIIGEGELRDKIELKIHEFELDEFVHLMGSQTQEEIINIMDMSSIFILPGIEDPETKRAEAQGLVIQEAQAMELPVIVSDVGGMKYGLIPNESGYIINQKDIKGFADAIEKLLKNDDLRSSMGKKGREFVVKNYDSIILNKKLELIYQA